MATAYPVGVAASYAGVIDPLNVGATDHHIMYAGQEDDFGANYIRRYKFEPPPGDPGDKVGPPPTASGGGGGGGNKACGMGQAGAGSGLGSLLALLEAGAGALLLALCPSLGRRLRPRARK